MNNRMKMLTIGGKGAFTLIKVATSVTTLDFSYLMSTFVLILQVF
jgi:hypothetical protein